jgi:outer membrane lipoprotein-sorting protein
MEEKMIRFLVLLALFFPAVALAGTPEERGLEIAKETDRRDTGFADFTVQMEMILRNRHGEESRRKVQILTMEMPDDGDKSLSIFDEPADIQGTALLTFTHKTGADDQWLFLPALKRVKRIASADKSGSFMGSEFAYEDIASQEVEKYTYKYLGDESYEGADCFKIERYPTDRYSGYKRQQAWVDKAEYRVMKVDYYDRKESLLKSLTFHGYRKYLDRYWQPDEMRMVNHQNGKSTRLLWSNYQFRKGLNPSDFTPEGLKRAR